LDADIFVSHLYANYGLDFRLYAQNSLERRIERLFQKLKINTVESLDKKLANNSALVPYIVNELAVGYTTFYRDPDVWQKVSELLIDKSTDKLKIWVAGCSTGEEVYTIISLLQHIKHQKEVDILATDMNEFALKQAATGVYPVRKIELAEHNLDKSHLNIQLKTFYHLHDNNAHFRTPANIKVEWRKHNLINEEYPGQFDMVFMRNILIYFSTQLQEFVLRKVHQSMVKNSILVLGKFEAFPIEKLGHKFGYISTAHNILNRE
jgi:chemotaxis protein methyltransferase CheR